MTVLPVDLRMIRRVSVVALTMCLVGCGGPGRGPTNGGAPSTKTATSDAGSTASSEAADAAVEKPFARTGIEASKMIDEAIDARQKELAACAVAARKKRKDEHARIVLDIGIDQEGTLLGVKLPKGAPPDDELITCAANALRSARFPRSNVGVITVKKTFEDVTVNP